VRLLLRRLLPRGLAAALGLAAAIAGLDAHAGLPVFCERGKEVSAAEQDRVLRFAGAVKAELDRSGASVALVARSGLDLSRFKLLYSHAGIALAANPGGRWAVRQLYYACDESRPRLFDQGMAGFVLGADSPARGHVALLFLPEATAAPLQRAALDDRLALSLLAARYSANAYAFGTRYQNCNQWVAELLAAAWGGVGDAGSGRVGRPRDRVATSPADVDAAADGNAAADGGVDSGTDGAAAPASHARARARTDARTRAQSWLRAQGYDAGPVEVPSHWLMFAGQFVPLVHLDDHPLDDIYALALHTSVPAAIENFVHARAPGTRRVELCHDESRIVVHRGWEPLGAACAPLPGDEVVELTR